MFKSAGIANFDKLLEKATSNLLLEVDLYAVLGICDLIRQKDCTPKYAIAAIKKKLEQKNPHVVFFALQVLESIVKNCGSPIHEEVATIEFMQHLRDLAKTTTYDNAREKILELIQAWAHAFRKLPSYRAVQDCYNVMKAEGSKFPPLIEADAMFCSDTAPEWQDGGCCNRCRVEFGLVNRKHHCRACGQIFCAKCSSKQATLPKFGIEKEVRVCDSCFEKYGKESESSDDPMDMLLKGGRGQPQSQSSLSSTKSPTTSADRPRGKTEEELAEEEQLQLALAISESEAEAKEREKGKTNYSALSHQSATVSSSSPETEKGEKKEVMSVGGVKLGGLEQEDPELSRYLDRNYWEQRHGQGRDEETTGAKAPSPFQPSAPINEAKNKAEQEGEIEGFMESLHGQIEIFTNRMKSNSSRGRHISKDTAVQTLFRNITALHSQLLGYIQAQDDSRSYYEGLQEKLIQVHDARDALDSLRKEHTDRLKRIAEEAERQRQFQMALKLGEMREQKHRYLQQMRDIALRRVQEEEQQMQLRIDQQRMGIYGTYGMPLPQGYGGQMGIPPNQQMGMQQPQMEGQIGMQPSVPGQMGIPPHIPSQQNQPQGQMGMQPQWPRQMMMQPQGQPQMGLPPHLQGQMGIQPQIPGQMGIPPQLQSQIGIQPPHTQAQMQPPHTQGQMLPPHTQGQMQPPHTQGQMHPSHTQGQMQSPHTQGQIQPPHMQGQIQPPHMQGQMQPHLQGQMGMSPHIPGQMGMQPQIPGQMGMQTQAQGQMGAQQPPPAQGQMDMQPQIQSPMGMPASQGQWQQVPWMMTGPVPHPTQVPVGMMPGPPGGPYYQPQMGSPQHSNQQLQQPFDSPTSNGMKQEETPPIRNEPSTGELISFD